MRLTDLLVADGVLDQAVVEEILRYANLYGGAIDTNVLETGLIDERKLQPYLEKTYSLKNKVDPLGEAQPEALRLLRRDQAETYRVIPMRLQMRALDVLVHDPTNVRAIDEVSFITGCRLVTSVAGEMRIADHLQRWYQVAAPDRLKALLAGRFAREKEMSIFVARREAVKEAAKKSDAGREFAAAIPTVDLSPAALKAAPTGWLEPTSYAATLPAPGTTEPIDLPTPPRPRSPESTTTPFARQPTPIGARPPLPRVPGRSDEIRRSYEELGAQLATVTAPHEVPPIVLPYLQVLLARVVLFLVYPEHMQGWDARGPRLKREAVELLRVPLTRPSVFLWVLQTGRAFEGTIPQEDVEEDLMIRLSGPSWPSHALVVPVRGSDTPVAILYGEAASADALAKAREPAAVISDLVGATLGRLIASGRWTS